MSNLNSLRIVTADYYMHYPLQGFDPCYSEFRGSAVKHVPVIRIFGTDADGFKTCMHIHGALPYLYIPCPDYSQTELDTFIYQVAISLDKAINLSLGQSSSESQHVFKVVCVKAIPFYGYHPNEHRFLKIYFYNPIFIRRAANLLQNGAILNKIHQPHESHLPYLLQFFIDFNLYGMSFLHVPAEVVRYRRRPQRNEQCDESTKVDSQMHSVECTSVSECEIDISAAHILNRFEIFDNSNGCHANPGIASIWNDERCRRSKMEGDCPPLEIPLSTQETSKVCEPTESETFYRQALIKKLEEPDDTVIDEQNSERTLLLPDRTMKKFNLGAYLSQLVYPAECTNQNSESMLDASIIVDHLSSATNDKKNELSSNHPADDSMVDEDLVLSLSQRCSPDETLNDEDKAFLEVLRKLEANEDDIDDDSMLAPFSQRDEKTDVILSQKTVSQASDSHQANPTTTELNYLDEDDDLMNEFSKNLDDILSNEIGQMSAPQLDGGVNDSPKLQRSKFQPLNITTQSPKLPNSVSESVVEILKGETEITVCEIPSKFNQTNNQSPNIRTNVPATQLIDLTVSSSKEEEQFTTAKMPQLDDVTNKKSSKKIFTASPIVKLKGILNSQQQETPFRRYPNRVRRPPANISATDDMSPRMSSTATSKRKQEKKDKKKPTESETSNRQPLIKKLEEPDVTVVDEQNSEHALMLPDRTIKEFNLDLSQLVYPAECTSQNSESILDASIIVDHLSSATNGQENEFSSSDETLNDEDKAISEIVRKLEANDGDVDDDNILGLFSQKHEKADVMLSQKAVSPYDSQANGSHETNPTTTEDDDLLNDILDDILSNEIGQMSIPQLDGGDNGSPKRPRPKFQPLNITIQSPKRPSTLSESVVAMLKGKTEITVCAIPSKQANSQTPDINKIPVTQLIDLTVSSDEEQHFPRAKMPRLGDISVTTSVTKVTSKLKVLRKGIQPLSIRYENSSTSSAESIPERSIQPRTYGKVKLSPTFKRIVRTSPIVKLKKMANSHQQQTPCRRYPNRVRRPPVNILTKGDMSPRTSSTVTSRDKQEKKDKKKPIRLELEDLYAWSDCKVALEHDKKYNFFPEPGPSHINYYEFADLPPSYFGPSTLDDTMMADTSEYDIHIQSMYEASMLHSPMSMNAHSPDPYFNISDPDEDPLSLSPYEISTPLLHSIKANFQVSNGRNQDEYIATPVTITPTAGAVLSDLVNYDLPQVIAKTPFYSNRNDFTGVKEVGNHILHIANLSECENYENTLISTGLNAWRRNAYTNIISMDENKLQNKSNNEIREFFAIEKDIIIAPIKSMPSVEQAELWVRNRKNAKEDEKKKLDIDKDSPIKIRREKAKVILENDGNGENSADDEENQCDVTLSCSPVPIQAESEDSKLVNKHLAKVSDPSVKARKSLTSKFDELKKSIIVSESPSMFSDYVESESPTNDVHNTDEEIPSSQIITIKHRNRINGHSETNSSNCMSESSPLVNSVNDKVGSSPYRIPDDSKSTYSPSHSFGITGATLENTFGFKMDLENFQTAKAHLEYNYLTTMSLEIHTQTRGNYKPDPQYDGIKCLFYAIQNDVPENYRNIPRSLKGFICVRTTESERAPVLSIYKDFSIKFTATEKELLLELIKLIALWDPDIFAGYEIEMASWGYVIQRGYAIDINMSSLLSRVTSEKINKIVNNDEDQDVDGERDFEIKLVGRIFLNVWRLLRSEIALTSYTFENTVYHILHRRIPAKTFADLTRIWNTERTRWIVFEYYFERCYGNLELLNQLDLIGRTCELAKLFGIQFFEVLSRGSQYRVESMMLRIAKPRNIISVSPSVQQRAHMKAPEYLPLILEPHSRLYADPLIVLDFQSLYPSMIIAYNYCFSTCLGRVELLGKSHPFEFGASQLRVSPTLLRKLIEKDLVNISPCGAVFVKPIVREGVLPRMLREILDTRLMVKQSMKLHKSDKLLQRILHSRQLGLKLMANVTYGYTAANFSGRMPCVEVGDSVVSKGRETLERAIKMVQQNKKWDAQVVYGDTDSLFVLCPGRAREDAFRIGNEIAEAVTNDNPYPVKLKLEKVYQPSILQTKKRYVGFMYEGPDQKEPKYEAKGIETVRRDGCPAVAKILEKTLKLLFDTMDVSLVKRYICRQLSKILSGQANIQDLIFAKEFRGIDGYKPNACVPSLELARKWTQIDRRAEPRRGERVPYIIVNGPPGVPLIRLVRSPHELLADDGLKINSMYYITKVIIPPLNRCLLLIGADVNQWFADLPRTSKPLTITSNPSATITKNSSKKSTISQYFSTTSCVTDCGEQTQNGICGNCQRQPQKSAVILSYKINNLERKYDMTQRLCQSCCGRSYDIECCSLDCPVLYVKNHWKCENKQVEFFREFLQELF